VTDLPTRARVGKRRPLDSAEVLTLENEIFEDSDFSDTKLVGFQSIKSRFRRCRFEGMQVEDATFGAGKDVSEYVECSFDRSRLRAPVVGQARFVACTFRDVRLHEWFARDAEFVDCVFSGRAEKALFFGAPDEERRDELGRSTNEFVGNDFTGMELRDVDFRHGVDLTKQRLPNGKEYLIVEDARRAVVGARDAVRFWDDDRDREYALDLLRELMWEVEDGQEQFLLRVSEWKRPQRRRAVFELLASTG
jgi:hypothetical protein